MTGARLAGFWIILHKLHDYCCNIFVSLMRLGSMSRVAKETGYETSFVSRRIAALEKSVASKLFERTTRLCMPTHEAHALLDRILPYVVDLERRLEMASRAVKATSGDVVLKVRCASGLLPFVVRAIKPFRDNHPEYKFEVSAVHTPPVGSVMDADLGIWASSGTSPHFTFEDLGVVPSWLCATPSFLERHSVRTVEDLDKVPLLGCSHWIAPFLIAPAVDPLLPVRRDLRMAVNFNSVQGLRDAVLEDTGVGASLPAYTVATDIVKGRMVRAFPNSPARPSSSDSCARRPTSPFLKSNDSHAGSSNPGDATWSFRPPDSAAQES